MPKKANRCLTALNNKKQYSSFDELRENKSKRTQNLTKLEQQRQAFMERHGACKVCGSPWRYIKGTNLLLCSNKDCSGVTDRDGTTTPTVIYLRSHAAEIADTLFD